MDEMKLILHSKPQPSDNGNNYGLRMWISRGILALHKGNSLVISQSCPFVLILHPFINKGS